MDRLSKLEQDALTNVLVVPVQRSSQALSDATGASLTAQLQGYAFGPLSPVPLWVVRQKLAGDLEGAASWCVTNDHARSLIRDLRRVSYGPAALTPLEREGLTEVGHMLIDATLEALASSLGLRASASVPVLRSVGTTSASEPFGAGVRVVIAAATEAVRTESRLRLCLGESSAQRFKRALARYGLPEASAAHG